MPIHDNDLDPISPPLVLSNSSDGFRSINEIPVWNITWRDIGDRYSDNPIKNCYV